jgi:pimeloyl-ACP methyl ester carboxylesterase
MALVLKILILLGHLKKRLTSRDLRVPLLALTASIRLAADPEIHRRLRADQRHRAAFTEFPFPGGADAFFVDTIRRAPQILAPTLVLWGEEDMVDPPETGRVLFQALAGPKQLHIIPGNGHVGHLDRNRDQVFALTADWVLKTLA